MRFRDDTPQLLACARATVAAWREQHPQGTYDELIDDLGPDFPRDYEPVLRSVLFALERHGANVLNGWLASLAVASDQAGSVLRGSPHQKHERFPGCRAPAVLRWRARRCTDAAPAEDPVMTRTPLNGRPIGLAPEEPEQVIRLQHFRQAHPDVIIGDGGFGTMQARIPEPNGENVITRYSLRDLLDKLDDLLRPPD